MSMFCTMGPTLGNPPLPRMESDVVYFRSQSPLTLGLFLDGINGLGVGFSFSSCRNSRSISSICDGVAVNPRWVSDANERILDLSWDRFCCVLKKSNESWGSETADRVVDVHTEVGGRLIWLTEEGENANTAWTIPMNSAMDWKRNDMVGVAANAWLCEMCRRDYS